MMRNLGLLMIGMMVVGLMWIVSKQFMDILIDNVIPATVTVTAEEQAILQLSLPIITAIIVVWLITKYTKNRNS